MPKKKEARIDPTLSTMGRPRKEIDWTQFEQLCGIQCTRSELASFLKVDQDTMITAAKKYYKIEDFSEIYKKFCEIGKCSLKRFQFVQAKTKPNMAIWLGKQWLDQRDAPEPPKTEQAASILDLCNLIAENNRLKELLLKNNIQPPVV